MQHVKERKTPFQCAPVHRNNDLRELSRKIQAPAEAAFHTQ